MCEHLFVYGGICYEDDTYHMPGTSAKRRHYYRWFYCSGCLEKRYEIISTDETSFDGIKFGATPK